jgi:hypothetical protein
MKLLLVNGTIEKLPIKVPSCYANPGLTEQLCREKLPWVSGPVAQFLTDIKRREDHKPDSFQQSDLPADQYSSRVIRNTSLQSTKSRVNENREDNSRKGASSGRRTDKSKDLHGYSVPSDQHTSGAAGKGTGKPRKEQSQSSGSSHREDRSQGQPRHLSSKGRSSQD